MWARDGVRHTRARASGSSSANANAVTPTRDLASAPVRDARGLTRVSRGARSIDRARARASRGMMRRRNLLIFSPSGTAKKRSREEETHSCHLCSDLDARAMSTRSATVHAIARCDYAMIFFEKARGTGSLIEAGLIPRLCSEPSIIFNARHQNLRGIYRGFRRIGRRWNRERSLGHSVSSLYIFLSRLIGFADVWRRASLPAADRRNARTHGCNLVYTFHFRLCANSSNQPSRCATYLSWISRFLDNSSIGAFATCRRGSKSSSSSSFAARSARARSSSASIFAPL